MKQILQRFRAETPQFFKNLINLSLSIAFLSGLIIGSGLVLPESTMGIIGQIGIVAGIVAAFIGKLTTLYGVDEDGVVIEKPKATTLTINPDTKPNPTIKN